MATENAPNQPNILRNAIHMDVLRQHERLIALPPVESVLCLSPVSFRYVRQDDPKFETLHKGVLSGSTVVGATGLCEDSTNKFITSWPAFMVNHGTAKDTASRLRSLQESCFVATPEERATAIKANDRAMHRYNRNKLKPFQAALRRYTEANRSSAAPDVAAKAAPSTACEASPPLATSAAANCIDTPPVPIPSPSCAPGLKTVVEGTCTPEGCAASAPAHVPPAISPSGSTPELVVGSPVSPNWSDEDLQELRRRGLDPQVLGQQLQVSLASVTGPGQRRTLVCSLSEPTSKAPSPAPPSPHVNEWLQGVPSVSLAGSKLPRSSSATRKGKARKKSRSGALLRRRTQDGSLSGSLSGALASADVSGSHSGSASGLESLAQRLDAGLQVEGQACKAVPPVTGSEVCVQPPAAADASAAIPAARGASAAGCSESSLANTASLGSTGGLGLAVVEPLEAVPHEELVRRGMQPWRIPQTMARKFGRTSETDLRLIWGQEQEAAALLEVLHIFPGTPSTSAFGVTYLWGPDSFRNLDHLMRSTPSGSTLHEVGLCMLDNASIPPDWEVPIESLPPIGSSPDGLIYHPALLRPPTTASGSSAQAAAADQSPEADITHIAKAAAYRQRQAMLGDRRWKPEVYEAIALPGLWEVVEVKNHCPFKETTGKGRARWACSDSGPRTAVPDQYIPQLQLEMLCAGLQSALLVSRSATRGTHIFRMWRSDRYCALLLRLAADFYQRFGRPGCRQPPPNFFASSPTYHEFCHLTADLKARTKLLCHLDPDDAPFDQSQPLFL